MKKFWSLIIFFIVLIGVIISIYSCTYVKYDSTIINNKFLYEESITNEIVESEYYYSDLYFSNESSKENEHLRTFSFALALSFTPTYAEDNINKYIQDIFDGIGLKDSKYYDDEIITKDTIGTALAHKKLNKDYELVVLVLRGSNYEDEWLSNFDIGSDGNAKGFNDSAKLVLDRLNSYLEDNNIDKYKLLITGYSRGGAIANIVGVTLNDETSYHINQDDLYVYTFDAARGSNNNKVYNNIHNIINKNDIVTYLYPEQINIYNNGNIIDITDNSRTLKVKCLNLFGDDSKDYGIVNKKEFISNFVNSLPSNREEYVTTLKALSNFYTLLNNKSEEEVNELFNYFKNNVEDDISIVDIISMLSLGSNKKLKNVYSKLISKYDSNYDSIKDIITKEEYDTLKEDINIIFKFFLPMIKKDLSYKLNGDTCSMYNTLTFISNIDEIVKEHIFSNNFELVKSMDSYYTKGN